MRPRLTFALVILASVASLAAPAAAQTAKPPAPAGGAQQPGKPVDADARDRAEVRELVDRLNQLVQKTRDSSARVNRVRAIAEEIDRMGKAKEADPATAVEAAKELTIMLKKNFDALILEARDVEQRVTDDVKPKVDGFIDRLETKAQLVPDAKEKAQYADLAAREKENRTRIVGQLAALGRNLKALEVVKERIDGQLDYLSHAKIAVETSGTLARELEDYNKNLREIAKEFAPPSE